jgi:hypothetical protein
MYSGETSTPGDKINPLGTNSPLGSKFAPRGEVKNGPHVASIVGAVIIVK